MRDDVALITMEDGKKNAVTQQALAELIVAFDKAEADAKAVVLAGRPGSLRRLSAIRTGTPDCGPQVPQAKKQPRK